MKKIFLLLSFCFSFSSILIGQKTLIKEWENSLIELPQGANVLVDRYKNAYLSGHGFQSGSGSFFLTSKLDSLGNFVWQNSFNPPNNFDQLTDVEIDTSGSIVLAGLGFVVGNGSSQGIIIKYNSHGDTLWTIKSPEDYSGKGNFRDVLIDEDQNIYALGSRADSTDDNATYSLILLKISSEGDVLWENTYYSTEGSYYIGHNIKLLSDRIVIFADNWPFSGGTNYVIHQIDYSGQTIANIENAYSESFSTYVTIDQDGSIFLGDEAREYKVTKLNIEGDTLWEFNEPFTGVNIPNVPGRLPFLESDGEGGVYVSGPHWQENTGYDILTTYLNNSGIPIWSQRYNYQGKLLDAPNDIFVDNQYVYLVGQSYQDSFNADYILLIYDKDTGEEITTARYDNLKKDIARSIFVEGNDVYISGYSYENVSGNGKTVTVKYFLDEATHTLQPISLLSPPVHVFPMPFSETFNIEQKEENLLFTRLEVFDIKGALIFQKEITDGLEEVSLPNLGKGDYLLKVIGKDREHAQIIVKQ